MPLTDVISEIKNCSLCKDALPHGIRPVFQASSTAQLLIVGQAPGRRVHETGIPFNDPSGDRLRDWLGLDRTVFYDPELCAIIPMGFCYPGTGKNGDLPPRKECAPAWRRQLLDHLPRIKTTIIIGQYAIDWHLGSRKYKNLTETVRHWQEYGPDLFVLPHPSPRNNIWLRRNPWFEQDVLPPLKQAIAKISPSPLA